MIRNPFIVYVAAFSGAIALYLLGWSDVYPPLSWDLLFFFAATFLAAGLLSQLVAPAVENISDYQPGLLHWSAGFLVLATFIGEIFLAGGIPLLLVMGGAKFFDMEAAAVHLHAFMFWSIYSTIRFADFLYTKRPLYLFEALMPIVFYVLMVYRGPAIICLMTWFFVYAIRNRGLGAVPTALIGVATAFVLLINGIVGDIRSPGQEHVAVPSKAFRESGMPSTVFWAYLYGTAPLGNLQLSVSKMHQQDGTVAEFLAAEFIPDTISKKILPLINPDIRTGSGNLQTRDDLYSWTQLQIAQGINTSTIFGRAYGFFGWLGPAIMFALLSAFIIAYLLLIQNSPYRVAALAWLNTTVMFCLINNMMVSAVTLLPLFLILVMPPWRSR